MRRLIVLLALAALAEVGGGCTTKGAPPITSAPGPINFAQRGVIALDAAVIDVIDQFHPPMSRPNVDHLATPPPSKAVRRWVAERLRAVGRNGSVQVTITDASIIEHNLPQSDGLKSLFTVQQAQQYDGRLEVRISGVNPDTKFSGYAQAVANRSITVPEDISLAGREETWNTLVKQMVEDIDGRIEQGLRDGLGPMVRR
ncbi:MAG: hypothetical protein WCK65_13645 [Rhodospirillaceae bacterium]